MVRFNVLKISSDGSCFTVNVSVDSASYYTNRYITDIFIDSDTTFNNSTTHSDKAVHVELDEHQKSFIKTFSATELSGILSSRSLKGRMLYVFVELDGAVTGDAPCNSDVDAFLGIAVDWNHIYHGSLKYMKQVTKECCNIPKEFIDYILRIKALELALKTGHYMTAKDLWNKFFSKKKYMVSSICGCNK